MNQPRQKLTESDWALIEHLPLFEGIDRPRIKDLLEEARLETRQRGQLLFHQGETADRFYFVVDGWIKLFRSSSAGHDSVVHVFTRGESFAEAAILADGRYPVSAEIAAWSQLLTIPAPPFLRGIEADPAIARNMLAAMSRHLRELVGRVEQLQSQPAYRRVAGFLLSITPCTEGPAEFQLPIDKALIAARLGIQPETLSRALAFLRRQGLSIAGGRIEVPDVARLRSLAQEY